MPDVFFLFATETKYPVFPKVTLTASALLQPPRRLSTCDAVRWMGMGGRRCAWSFVFSVLFV